MDKPKAVILKYFLSVRINVSDKKGRSRKVTYDGGELKE